MKKIYWIMIGAVILLIPFAAWFLFKNKEVAANEWKTAKVEKGDLRVTVTATGTLNAVTTVQVGTQVSGIINKIFVDFNSVVKEGQVIALLDTTYLAQAVEDASASLQRTEIAVTQTRREYERTKTLFDQKVMAQADYDLALSAYETAVTNARSARAALNRARINLRYATIQAPIAGVVVSRAVDVGQTVAASFNTPTLFTIANDLTKMQVQASVDEADIGKIKVGQEVTFTVDAYDDQTFSGMVRQVRLQPVVLQNVVNYTVIVDVPNPDMKLLPGMTASITVMVEELKDILKIPASALKFTPPQEYLAELEKKLPDSLKQQREKWARNQQGGTPGGMPGSGRGPGGSAMGEGRPNIGRVWVVDGADLKQVRVRIGPSDGSSTEVRGRNIREGDVVVTGIISAAAKNAQKQQNPFAPQMPQGGRGGR